MTNAGCLNILGLVLQIVGIIVIGLSVKRASPSAGSPISGVFTDEKTRKYVTTFTLPNPRATWGGIRIIIVGLIFLIVAELIR